MIGSLSHMSKADVIVKRNGEIRMPHDVFAKLKTDDIMRHVQARARGSRPFALRDGIKNLTGMGG